MSNIPTTQATTELDASIGGDESVSLRALLNPELEPLFRQPNLLDRPSAWHGHIPFAHWLVRVTRPKLFVELGTHAGVSYSAFCSSVIIEKTDTKCFAVDTWKGEQHAGHYGENIYTEWKTFHDQNFSQFSTLLRSTFDDAVNSFEEQSIDLLHIDGFHTYEAVSHDFISWLPKLSDNAVVLFHDTNEHKQDFGVWRFWAEFRSRFPSFEFLHSHGLGVLAVGKNVPRDVKTLCGLNDETKIEAIRQRFQTLGAHWALEAQTLRETQRHREELTKLAGEKAAALERVKVLDSEKAQAIERARTAEVRSSNLDRERKEAIDRVKNLETEKAHALARTNAAEICTAELKIEISQLAERLASLESENTRNLKRAKSTKKRLASAQREIAALMSSSSWRVTAPFRKVGRHLPTSVRLVFRRLITLSRHMLHPRATFHQYSEFRKIYKCIAESGLFDEKWYFAHYPEVALARMDPIAHYIRCGVSEGKAPSRQFDTAFYLKTYRDVRDAGINPLFHFLTCGKREGRKISYFQLVYDTISSSPLFDKDWYLSQYQDVAAARLDPVRHYIEHGASEGRTPSEAFDTQFYLNTYPDVDESGINPLFHYITAGQAEGRLTSQVQLICETISASHLFDREWYRARYPDVAASGMNPIDHYLLHGVQERRNPSDWFDTAYYCENNPDVVATRVNPLLHFILHGQAEGRAPKPRNDVPPYNRSTPAATRPKTEQGLAIFVSGESTDRPGYVYRIQRNAEALKRAGYDVIVLARSGLPSHYHQITEASFLFIWRATWEPDVQQAVTIAKKHGVKVIFDLDDLMVRLELVDEKYIDAIRFERRDPQSVAHLYERMVKTLHSADMCTASTLELAWQMRSVSGGKPTFVVPNGYCEGAYLKSRQGQRMKAALHDGLVRLGYASGSRTHQADFRQCARAVARILRENDACRLVLFRREDSVVTLDPVEFPELAALSDRIEWRTMVPLEDVPIEVARFDINLAPLEYGNPFVEAKSELKYFEAAICDVPTVASPSGPFARSIIDGVTGFLARTEEEWYDRITALVQSPALRNSTSRAAHRSVLWHYGPAARAGRMFDVAEAAMSQRRGALAFQRTAFRPDCPSSPITIPEHEACFEMAGTLPSRVTVVVPLFDYARYVIEALDSVASQTLLDLDLIVVDDCSTDDSNEVTFRWMKRHHQRFNRCTLVRHVSNQGLGAARNTGIDLADSLFVVTLDADNRIRPTFCEKCLEAMDNTGAIFAYSNLEVFGDESGLLGRQDFEPGALVAGNYIDALAMISKEAWAFVGGYTTHRMGWQDYDFWCRLVERGLFGVHVDEILADYRVHNTSMLRTSTDRANNKTALVEWMEEQHPWLSLLEERAGHRVRGGKHARDTQRASLI